MSWIYNGRKYWYHKGKKYSCKLKRKKRRIGYFVVQPNYYGNDIHQVCHDKYCDVKAEGRFRTFTRYLRDDEQELL